MSNLIKPSIVLTFFVLVVSVASTDHALSADQPHVCPRTLYFTESRIESKNQPLRVKTYTWCWALPPWCSNDLMQNRIVYWSVLSTKSRVKYQCCRGYHQVGSVCKPISSLSCGNGECTDMNKGTQMPSWKFWQLMQPN